jgi:aspartyl-tRNA(Asn)/glutamyl-tRNA(Gln) amidotransferase subunit C
MIDAETIKKLAELARLKVADSELDYYTKQLNNILSLEEKLQALKTDIKPLFHSLDVPQRLRPDVITETNQRELMQSIAPKSLAGLYLVPKVIE